MITSGVLMGMSNGVLEVLSSFLFYFASVSTDVLRLGFIGLVVFQGGLIDEYTPSNLLYDGHSSFSLILNLEY